MISEMAGSAQHPWKITIEEARAVQLRLSRLVEESDRLGEIRCVAGVDLSGVRSSGNATAAAVLLSFPGLQLVEENRVEGPLEFPYLSGFLSFREAPLTLEALRGLKTEPDLILVDGQGRAHPRRLGIASHLGLIMDKPTIGCAKSRLVGRHGELGEEAGSTSPLVYRGEVVGVALRTKRAVKPIFVSVGHRISLSKAVDLVLRCTVAGQRIPEPTRQAHLVAGREPGATSSPAAMDI
ncbi:MAG: deoxyribonuclease V [Actinobacteria bacterium]|nr:deoxyribonuclease V [Actinomycetota bacterium]